MGILLKRLKKEVRKNPGKTGVLAILTVVATILWGPKLVSQIGGWRNDTLNRTGAVPDGSQWGSEVTHTTGQSAQIGENSESDMAWTRLTRCKWAAFELPPQWRLPRDPFAPLPIRLAEKPSETEAVQDLSSGALTGLRCTGVVVTPSRRLAAFDGQLVEEGQILKWQRNGQTYQARVVRIEPTCVILEVHGQKINLRLAELGLKVTP